MPTAAEKKWIARLQEVLDDCPSKRLGFYTIGDLDVHVYDKRKDAKITDRMERGVDFCIAVNEHKASLGRLRFPSNVHSTAG